MNRKVKNFFRMNSCLKPGSLLQFYWLKYFADGTYSEKKYFNLKNGLRISVVRKAGDLTTFYEIFVDEDYKFTGKRTKGLKILDIGANVGYFSLYISQKFPDSQIFSFEPFPETYGRLQENLNLNKSSNVKIYRLAVSDFNGQADFYSIDWAGCNTLVKDKFDEGLYQTTKVQTVAFEEINKLTGVEEFDYAKIDCEGSEYPIFLKSPDSNIKTVKNYVIEVHGDSRYSGNDLVERFNKLGYKTNYGRNILTAERIG